MKIKNKFILVIASILVLSTSCEQEIDDSNLYTFTGEMMMDHLNNNPEQFELYCKLLKRVHPSVKSESTVDQLLGARGNYTCFAPINSAIQYYLDSLKQNGIIETNVVEDIPDSIAESIVFNSIIDCQNSEAYAYSDFNEGALTRTNMNDRYVDISFGNDSVTNEPITFVNANSKVLEKDIKVENGYLHVIDKVLSPSNKTIEGLIRTTENLRYFSELLDSTGWSEKIQNFKDASYELNEKAGEYINGGGEWNGSYPEHRKFGFTVFTETDSVFENKLGVTSTKDLFSKLNEYLKANSNYKEDTKYDNDYRNPENAINQFVAYHILPEALTWNNLIIYSNEGSFYNSKPNDGKGFSLNVWEYYETLDPHRRSIKITGTRTQGRRINRYSVYRPNFQEKMDIYTGENQKYTGIKINPTNGRFTNSALNGTYFTIEDILLWTQDVQKKVLNERMRYDVTSLMPELLSNNLRRFGDSEHQAWYFTPEYFSFDNGGSGSIINVSKETRLIYLTNIMNNGGESSWTNFQCDEFNIKGIYDFVMKLPPVPNTGTYEIRYGVNANSNRGMAQIYIGTNPNNLPAVGIPIDLRIDGNNAALGWKKDADLTAEEIEELDKSLRNKDYMKGPKYFCPGQGITGRDCAICLRKIIYRGQLEEGKTYYIRFKSVLESPETQFFYDYLEFVPKSVYNGDKEPEDKW